MTNTLFFLEDKKDHEAAVRWACSRIPWLPYSESLRGVAVGDVHEDDRVDLLAVCLYHSFLPVQMIDGKPWYGLCEISFAAESPRWATRTIISSLLKIPFQQYNCRKVVTVIPSTNKRAIRFNEGIGLKPEGTLRHHFAKGVHACIHGMMRSEFEQRWKDPRPAGRPGSQVHGQRHTINTASAAAA